MGYHFSGDPLLILIVEIRAFYVRTLCSHIKKYTTYYRYIYYVTHILLRHTTICPLHPWNFILHLYTLHLHYPNLHIYISTSLHTCLLLALYLTLHFTSLMTVYAYMHINIDQQTRLQIYFV